MDRSEDTLSAEQKGFAAADLQTKAEWNAALFEIERDNWSTYVRRVLHAREGFGRTQQYAVVHSAISLQRSPLWPHGCGNTEPCGATGSAVTRV